MTILVFIKDLVIAAFGQMASIFGGIFVFGLLIHFISRLTFASLEKAFGVRATYLVASIGTPIHEAGHAVFCLIFGHRITDIAFFKPDPDTGELGYVAHRWNPKNPWHVLGNFFIGIGPVIFGCAVLFAVFYLLVPNSSIVWDSISDAAGQIEQGNLLAGYLTLFKDSGIVILNTVFTAENLSGWQFWVFFYLAVCIASNIRLSPSDLKGALSGLGCVILPFLLLNLIGMLSGWGDENFIPLTAASLGVVSGIFVLALIMSLAGFIITYPIAAAYTGIRHGYFLRPF
jgi:hypothetical protein